MMRRVQRATPSLTSILSPAILVALRFTTRVQLVLGEELKHLNRYRIDQRRQLLASICIIDFYCKQEQYTVSGYGHQIRTPDPNYFQNLTGPSLSKDTSVVKFT